MERLDAKRDRDLLELKRAFIRGEAPPVPDEYDAVVREWQRSVQLGIDADLRLGDLQRDFDTFRRLDKIHPSHLQYLNYYYSSREKLITSFGGAIFYLDEKLSAYNKFGDPHLLTVLKDNGVRIGTNFREENVGVFVANVAIQSPFETFCRVGQENYLQIFSGYACYARYMGQSGRQWRSVNLVFIPRASYGPEVDASVQFLLETEDISANVDFIYPNLSKRIDFLERISRSSHDIFMLLDTNRDVLFTNDLFQKEFGKAHKDSELEAISSFMPELADTPRFKRGLSGKFNFEVSLKNASDHEARYTVFGNEEEGCGYRLCFVPHIPNGNVVRGIHAQHSFQELIGKAPSFVYALAMAERAASTLTNVLIIGESGTGKELVAQAIHASSPRNAAPFIPVNCAAIPKDLINSELLGFEEGAFTGARRGGQVGKFELASGGTIFLDEISEMPLDMQGVLLRILEDRVVNRLGSTKYYPVDTRIIAATNKDLWKCVEEGTFRLDLYFRLNIILIELPPLRERDGDLELLTAYMLENASYRNRVPVVTLSEEVMELFRAYSWPGNIRELKNVIERCVVTANVNPVTMETLPQDIYRQLTRQIQKPGAAAEEASARVPRGSSLKEHERALIEETLRACGGNKSDAAKRLGISRATLYKRMQAANLTGKEH